MSFFRVKFYEFGTEAQHGFPYKPVFLDRLDFEHSSGSFVQKDTR